MQDKDRDRDEVKLELTSEDLLTIEEREQIANVRIFDEIERHGMIALAI